jgi:hypothetical protein
MGLSHQVFDFALDPRTPRPLAFLVRPRPHNGQLRTQGRYPILLIGGFLFFQELELLSLGLPAAWGSRPISQEIPLPGNNSSQTMKKQSCNLILNANLSAVRGRSVRDLDAPTLPERPGMDAAIEPPRCWLRSAARPIAACASVVPSGDSPYRSIPHTDTRVARIKNRLLRIAPTARSLGSRAMKPSNVQRCASMSRGTQKYPEFRFVPERLILWSFHSLGEQKEPVYGCTALCKRLHRCVLFG